MTIPRVFSGQSDMPDHGEGAVAHMGTKRPAVAREIAESAAKLARSAHEFLSGCPRVRCLPAVVLIAAGCLKAQEVFGAAGLSASRGAGNAAVLSLAAFEVFLGLWIISGLFQPASCGVGGSCFVLFSGISLYKTIAGDLSCGCFGTIRFPPWFSLLLDLGCSFVLLASQWRALVKRFPALPRAIVVCTLWLAMVGLVAITTRATRSLTGQGVVVVEPENWLGERLALLDEIDIGHELSTSEWLVVLHRPDCAKCRDLLQTISRLVQEPERGIVQIRIAAIEVPSPHAGHSFEEDRQFAHDGMRVGGLSDARRWFVETPLAVLIADGSVTAIHQAALAKILPRQQNESSPTIWNEEKEIPSS